MPGPFQLPMRPWYANLITTPVHGDVNRVREELHEEDVRRQTEGGEAAPADVVAPLGEDAEVLVVVDHHLGVITVSIDLIKVPIVFHGVKGQKLRDAESRSLGSIVVETKFIPCRRFRFLRWNSR